MNAILSFLNHLGITLIVSKCCCGRYLGIKRGYGVYGISHGLCRGCYEREIAKVRG